MNQEFLEYALGVLDNLTDEQIYQGLVDAGLDPDSITIRQFPEIPEEELLKRQALSEPYRHPFLNGDNQDE